MTNSTGSHDEKISKKTFTGEYPVLVAGQGPFEGRRWIIKDELIIGREPDCHIPIEDRQVSRHHARVTLKDNVVELEDLASKNGTFHLGNRVKDRVRLNDGDAIQIAMIQKFIFYTSDATMPLESFESIKMPAKGRINLDRKSRRVWINEEEVLPPLSVPQFRLLAILVDQHGKVVPRNDLINEIWVDEDGSGVSEQALDALIRRLRDRLMEFDPQHKYIVTMRGHGIRLDDD
jgi:pSer/pThr/pTyr-binding forkhead associated (FHA) protein